MTPGKALLYLIVALVLFFLAVPNFIVAPISFSPTSVLEFPPRGFSLKWYDKYFTQPGWLAATFTSFYVAFLTVIVSLAVGSAAAYGIVRGDFPGKRLLNSFFLFPIIIPSLLTAIAIFRLFSYLGWTGTTFGFVLGHSVLAVPFVITIMTASFRGIDVSVENAARNLGANRIRTVLHVTVPMAMPGFLSAGLFAFLVSFDELLIALFLSSPRVSTLPKRLWEGIQLEIDPSLAAVSTILVLISLAVLVAAGLIKRKLEAK
ncbi:hypothetical protein RA19_19280 [Leisingera sp. ANG-M1]|nr:hypothetical protein RA19_19280 [Leisingera sp. ANG-M1]